MNLDTWTHKSRHFRAMFALDILKIHTPWNINIIGVIVWLKEFVLRSFCCILNPLVFP